MPHLDSATIVGVIVALAGLARYLLDRHDRRLTEAAKTATDAQHEAMANKDREIDGWKQRYEQEHHDHEDDTTRYENRISHLENLLYNRKGRD